MYYVIRSTIFVWIFCAFTWWSYSHEEVTTDRSHLTNQQIQTVIIYDGIASLNSFTFSLAFRYNPQDQIKFKGTKKPKNSCNSNHIAVPLSRWKIINFLSYYDSIETCTVCVLHKELPSTETQSHKLEHLHDVTGMF